MATTPATPPRENQGGYGYGPARVRDWATAEPSGETRGDGRRMTAAETVVVVATPMRIECWTADGQPDEWLWGPDDSAGDDAWAKAGCQPWQIASGAAATKRAARSRAVKEGRRR